MSDNHINRRNFLKVMGVGAGAAAAAAVPGCSPKKSDSGLEDESFSNAPVPTDKMTYRIDPKTKEKVSLLGYGCMRFPSKVNEKGEDEIDQETVAHLVDYALKHGVTYFDTAPAYGQSEDVVGNVLVSKYPRDKFTIATKLSSFDQALWTREGSEGMYHNSFKRMKLDYIDYYLLHGVGMGAFTPGAPQMTPQKTFDTRFVDNGMLDFLLKEREAGRIRHLGFSFHGPVEAFDYALSLHDKYKWDFVQIQLNYVDWENHENKATDASYLYGELDKRHIPAVIMEPLLGGRLARLTPLALEMLKKMHPDVSPASWGMRFAGSLPDTQTILSGMTYMEHLQDNIRSLAPLKELNQAEKDALKKVAAIILDAKVIPCTQCKYCMPCPYGLNIPEVFAHYNRCINDKMMPENSTDANYTQARREFLYGMDNSVPKLRQASHCIGCKQCESKCPQRIQISDQMERINKITEFMKQDKPYTSKDIELPKPQGMF